MKEVKIILVGLGTVNIGLLRILSDKENEIATTSKLAFSIVAVADSTGVAINTAGFDYDELIAWKEAKKKVNQFPGFQTTAVENIADHVRADLLIESSSGNLKTGMPGLAIARNALARGVSVVLANKAPLVFAFDELHATAQRTGAGLAFSATVCGGLPVVNVLQRDLKFATLKSFRGILNATTNFILHEIERGGSPDEAVREAQRLGAAEADPSHDVNGHDTANKLLIVMKAFTGYSGSISDITVQGIQQVDRQQVGDAARNGEKIKLLATANNQDGMWKLAVKPMRVPIHSFFGTCDKWEMGIELETDLYESISMKNYEADPVGTSAAVLRDAISLFGVQKE